ncbi:trimeric LpxA-like protein [Hyaloraphidium curvatum]|nr:trimeric LpxA-like protein [Hyaloraphidium curvatum]
MGSRALLLRGGGGQAGAVYDIVADDYAAEISEGRAACWDDGGEIHPALVASGFNHLRTAEEVLNWLSQLNPAFVDALLCHGDPAVLRKMVGGLEALEADLPTATRLRFPPIVAPNAAVARTAVLGRGCFVGYFCRVGNACRIGEFARLGGNSTAAHDCIVEEFAQLNGRVHLGGAARIGADCVLGLGTLVRDKIAVAEGTVTGMGTVLNKDVLEPGRTWVGMPARALEKRERGHKRTGWVAPQLPPKM